MKICFLLVNNSITGGTFVIYEHARRLVKKGHDVLLVFQDERTELQITDYPNMQDVSTCYLGDLVDAEPFDWAIATWWETAFHVNKIPAFRYAYLLQDRQEEFYQFPYRTHRVFIEKTCREDFTFFVVAKWLQDYLKMGFQQESILIRNAVDYPLFSGAKPAYSKCNRLRVLVEGPGREGRKRIPLAFSVLSAFSDIDVYYVTADGYRDPSWKIDRFFSSIPFEDMPGIYASCDVLLKLSAQESFSLPVLEMFATGGTAIVSAFDGHDEYIKNGHNALVVPIDDEKAAHDAIRKLLESPTLLAKLKNGAAETARKFSWDDSSQIFEEALEQISSSDDKSVTELRVIKNSHEAYEDYKELLKMLNDRQKIIDEMYASTTWKLGRFLLAPFKRWGNYK